MSRNPRTDRLEGLYTHAVRPCVQRARGNRSLRHLREMEVRLSLPRPEAERVALERLRVLLSHARAEVPLYADRMRESGFDPARLSTLADLAGLPPLTRRDVAARPGDLLARSAVGTALVEARTGGSTSKPVPFLQTRAAIAVKDGAATVLRRRLGWDVGARFAGLWGASQDAPPTANGPVHRAWRAFRGRLLDRALYLPASDLDEATLDRYAVALRGFRPTVLQAYPSAADLLARRLASRGERLDVPITVLTAEPVLPGQRTRVAEAFRTEVRSFYGAREVGWIASETATCLRLHLNTACLHVERAADGRLLVTDLVNEAMPLLRYEVGDRGTLDPEPCPCGDPRPVLDSIDGRSNDVFRLPSGRLVPGVLADIRTYRIGLGVQEVQLVQDEIGAIDVRWVAGPRFAERDLETLRTYLDETFFHEVAFRFHRIERILPEANGKVRYCVSRVGPPSS